MNGNSLNDGALVLKIAQSCPNLKCLHLPPIKGNADHILQMHHHLPNLEELRLFDPIDLPLENYTNLRRIEIVFISGTSISVNVILRRLARLEHLKHVKLDGDLNGILPPEFAANQRKLRYVNLF